MGGSEGCGSLFLGGLIPSLGSCKFFFKKKKKIGLCMKYGSFLEHGLFCSLFRFILYCIVL